MNFEGADGVMLIVSLILRFVFEYILAEVVRVFNCSRSIYDDGDYSACRADIATGLVRLRFVRFADLASGSST